MKARDVLPSPASKAESIHRPRHLDIGKQDIDLRLGRQNFNGFSSVRRLYRVITTIAQILSDNHTNQDFIIDDKHRRRLVLWSC